ncbi:hypothetical protein CFP56_015269 [Quercus suber]|uniref:E3 ubiquitin-protein ligase APD1-4 middle domain-containing protein n=1 Tax=Quercus suber TaxID=58331 RepID=A0AAW0M2N7_QUESU
MVLGPSSSRLMQASSVFVEQVEVRDDDKRGVFLYAFSEKPELSYQTNWSVSDYVIVRSYSRKGFSFWLNKGSTIHMRWEAPTSTFNQLEVVMTKGERDLQTLSPEVTNSTDFLALHEPISGKEVEYTIEEDDKYYIGVINSNRRSIIMSMAINVSATMYDTTKAKSKCSTETGSCRLRLEFPNTHYVILTTPNYGNLAGWYIELSFVARVVTYIAILGFIVIVVFLILKYLGACEGENTIIDTEVTEVRQVTETDPIMPAKPIPYTYGTGEEDDDSGDSSSSEELYDAKLIMEGENKVCPICRRLIHKLRRLFHS